MKVYLAREVTEAEAAELVGPDTDPDTVLSALLTSTVVPFTSVGFAMQHCYKLHKARYPHFLVPELSWEELGTEQLAWEAYCPETQAWYRVEERELV